MDLVNNNGYELIVLTENVVAGFASLLGATAPVLLVKHSVHAVDAADQRRRQGEHHPRWMLEEHIVKRFEAESCRAATVVCCVTREDADQLVQRYRLSNPVEPIPIGVDLSQFPCRGNDPNTKLIGFFGNLTWGANVDAVRWFCHEVLPLVWRTHPDAGFVVLGPGSDQLRSLSQDARVRFFGRVPSIPEAMKSVSVGVTPIISGTGIRFKLLEMLSMGIPTVSTNLGAEGTHCVDGEHLLIADNAETFARSVDTLLRDAALRQRLAASGARLASACSWESIYPKILEVFDLACRKYQQNTIDARVSQAQS
jgi:glycosyltransferase involved in cell wall biosynthesis